MAYDPINYTAEELEIFQKIKRMQNELSECEELAKQDEKEGGYDLYRSKKLSIKLDILGLVRELNQFGISSTGLGEYEDIEQHESFWKWCNKVSEQEQIKIYEQLEQLNKSIKEEIEFNKEDRVTWTTALITTKKQKFFNLIKSLDLYGVDTKSIETAQEAIDEYNTEWDLSKGKNTLTSWHFEVLGIKGCWELAKIHTNTNKPSFQKK